MSTDMLVHDVLWTDLHHFFFHDTVAVFIKGELVFANFMLQRGNKHCDPF